MSWSSSWAQIFAFAILAPLEQGSDVLRRRPMNPVQAVNDAARDATIAFPGQMLQPSDVGYDDARRVHNGLIDKRPALIARCRGTPDVVQAIKVRRDLGLEVAVRGGGHNVAGRATI